MEYSVIYSNRKTVSLSIKDGALTVRAPHKTEEKRIAEILNKHQAWIKKHLIISAEKEKRFENLTEEKIKELKKEAKKYFSSKKKEFSKIMGLNYGRITITSAKTRFGSCSSKGNISFSYRLMLYPIPAREYVIVHELCHLVYMNHSRDFYRLISMYLPDYKERKRLLK